jgi:hypothetical protein
VTGLAWRTPFAPEPVCPRHSDCEQRR